MNRSEVEVGTAWTRRALRKPGPVIPSESPPRPSASLLGRLGGAMPMAAALRLARPSSGLGAT